MTFAVEFKDKRLGRRHDVEPEEFVAKSPGQLPDVLYTWAKKHLASREVEIAVYDDGTGTVTVGGFRRVGEFTWREVSA